jgi:hypothetical protein
MNHSASLDVPAPAKYAEWYGKPGRHLVGVRTRNCGGYGNWSDAISHALDDSIAPPTSPALPPPPPPGKNDDERTKTRITTTTKTRTRLKRTTRKTRSAL